MDSTEYYAHLAPRYIPDDAFWRRYHQRRFDTFNGLVPAGRRRLLDFGCGTGENVVLLAGRGHDVVGIDPVPEMVERARAQLAAAGLPPDRARVGDLGWLAGQPAGAFDAVTALNVLPYLTEDEEAAFYREARRLTGPDGCVVVSHTNELVDLVTFNRYTVEFWRDRIIPELAEAPAEREELLGVLAAHLTRPDVPARDAGHRSERDFLRKRRINPLDYPERLRARHGWRVEATAFTHAYPMPPQFMEASARYRERVFAFEDRFRESPLRYVFCSIVVYRAVPDA